MAATDLAALEPPLHKNDVLIGIASSGRTPYVIGGLKYARSMGAATVGLCCVKPSSLRGLCDVLIECVTGPEVVTGSTRLKAGTATKMVRPPLTFCRILGADIGIDPQHDFDRLASSNWQNLRQLGKSR